MILSQALMVGFIAFNYNAPTDPTHKVYINTDPAFVECELQDNTTYAGRRFLCVEKELTPPTTAPTPRPTITK